MEDSKMKSIRPTYFKCPECGNFAPKLEDIMFCSKCATNEIDKDGKTIRKQFEMKEVKL